MILPGARGMSCVVSWPQRCITPSHEEQNRERNQDHDEDPEDPEGEQDDEAWTATGRRVDHRCDWFQELRRDRDCLPCRLCADPAQGQSRAAATGHVPRVRRLAGLLELSMRIRW